MSFTRRKFIQCSAVAAVGPALLPKTVFAADNEGSNPLYIPPLIESRRGQPIFLMMQDAHWAFNGRNQADCIGFNGMYLGPTVKVWNGDDVKLIYSNRLTESVSMMVSGLHVPGPLSGGAPRLISSEVDWSPILPIRQPAATLWYHANTAQHAGSQVYRGLAGLWLVEDDVSKQLPLPKHYGVDDIPLIIQDKRLDNFGTPVYEGSSTPFLGDTLLVNGTQKPYFNASRGWVRLRLLNASNARRYLLQLSDNRPFTVIAGDQGFMSAPVTTTQLSLAPGERREVLIDLSDGHNVSITAGTEATIMERIRGIFEPSTVLTSTLVLTLRPTGLLPLVTDSVPTSLVSALETGLTSQTRHIRLNDSPAGINDRAWDAKRVDITAQQGSFERWTVEADLPQSFSIQGAMFLIKSVNGAPPMVEDRGWKDTVWVDGSVEMLVTFPQTSSAHFPFIYGSQTLEQFDQGVVGQLRVQPSANSGNSY
ncbi:cell division protein FtsP [Rosenbergiella epipactidis]|uniref:cell division protein FtsP n=1 Tax=Rosenbergiella epipactidis TaxID=1544694 RepID=UPI001BD96E94|nr:cell division protein FtsP [Rosenbergiella epipactidis]MBT0718384.1 cell division protein FtsP [Rosenbergiella epipactidis]